MLLLVEQENGDEVCFEEIGERREIGGKKLSRISIESEVESYPWIVVLSTDAKSGESC